MADTSRIHALVVQARRRLRIQSALETATLAVIPASALAAVAVYLVRRETITPDLGLALLGGAVGLVLAGAVFGALRRFSTAAVATRIDRASGLADRLASACAFEEQIRAGVEVPEETRALMEAAIDDAVRAAPRADVKGATRFAWPRDTRAAAAFLAAAAIVSSLGVELPPRDPAIAVVNPPAAARGTAIELKAARMGGDQGTLLFGRDAAAPIAIWEAGRVRATVPSGVAVGRTTLTLVTADGRRSRPVAFEVLPDGVDLEDRNQPVALSQEDIQYARDLVKELRATAEANQDDSLRKLADEIEKLLQEAEKGELSKAELLDRLQKAHDKYMAGATPKEMQEALKELEKTGQELKQSQPTQEIGRALEQGDLDKAQKEMEKLADKIANEKLSDKEREEAAKALEKAAKEFEKREAEREQKADKDMQKTADEARQLEQQMKQEKNEQKKQEMAQKLLQKQQQMKQQQQDKQQREQSQEKRQLKELHRKMDQAAQQMKSQNQQQRRQASNTMKDMARDTGKVDGDRRKITQQQKVASQLDDLKEAMRRAKRGGSRGPQDQFGRNQRNADFNRRAKGGQGQKGAWQPGQNGPGQKPGQQPGGQGQQPGGDSYGDSHDPDLIGDATRKGGHEKDESLQGLQGKGPSTRETVVSAAQKGFASRSYEQVYTSYKEAAEEAMHSPKIPTGYKYYVRKYFDKIRPEAQESP